MNIRPWQAVLDVLPPLGLTQKEELKRSIKDAGVKQSILVLPDGRIIDGHHRWELSDGKAPCTVLDLPELKAFELAIDLNLARRQLSIEIMEEVREKKRAYLAAAKKKALALRAQGATQKEAADAVGVARNTVSVWENIPTVIASSDDSSYIFKPDQRVKIPKTEHGVIVELLDGGYTQEEVAATYQVTQPHISRIVNKKRKRRQRERERQERREAGIKIPEGFNLIHGDLFDVNLPTDVDLVLTDFPYNISEDGKFTKLGDEAASFDAGEWDKGFDTPAAIARLAEALRPGGALVFFTDRAAISLMWQECQHVGLEPKNIIVWYKTNPVPNARRNFASATEFILWAVKPGAEYTWNGDATTHNLFECPICGGNERLGHPTQKPVALLRWLLELFSNDGDVVLDPCAGVGSTGATGLVRRYWLIEREEKFFDLMEDRYGGAA